MSSFHDIRVLPSFPTRRSSDLGTYVYDDRYILLQDPRVGDAARWGEYWTKDYFYGGADNLYRPLVSMSYAIQAKLDRKSTRLNSSHLVISYAVFCLKQKNCIGK